MSENSQKFLTVKEILAEYPNLFSATTLWRLDKRGELKPCGRIGKKSRIYLRETVENYLMRDELKSGR